MFHLLCFEQKKQVMEKKHKHIKKEHMFLKSLHMVSLKEKNTKAHKQKITKRSENTLKKVGIILLFGMTLVSVASNTCSQVSFLYENPWPLTATRRGRVKGARPRLSKEPGKDAACEGEHVADRIVCFDVSGVPCKNYPDTPCMPTLTPKTTPM